MVKILILILTLMSTSLISQGLTVKEWHAKYNRPCKNLKMGMVCKEILDAALERMRLSGVDKIFVKSGLPPWLATIGIVESGWKVDTIKMLSLKPGQSEFSRFFQGIFSYTSLK